MSFTKALSALSYLSTVLFVDTVLQGTLTVEKSQDGVSWNIGNFKFNNVPDVLTYCGPITGLRIFDTDTEEEKTILI